MRNSEHGPIFSDSLSLKHLLKGFEKAFEGRSLPPFPENLNRALLKARGQENILLSLRGKDKVATTKALDQLKDGATPLDLRIQITRVLGDVKADAAVPVLIGLVKKGKQNALRQEAMLSLQKFNNQEIGEKVKAQLRFVQVGATQKS